MASDNIGVITVCRSPRLCRPIPVPCKYGGYHSKELPRGESAEFDGSHEVSLGKVGWALKLCFDGCETFISELRLTRSAPTYLVLIGGLSGTWLGMLTAVPYVPSEVFHHLPIFTRIGGVGTHSSLFTMHLLETDDAQLEYGWLHR